MINQSNRAGTDRRSQSLADIHSLVSSRSETLSLYTGLASHRPFNQNANFTEELKHFCEALIDYTASAHFRLYQHLAENRERRQAVLNVADNLYPKIADTTDEILEFNDRYGDEKNAALQTQAVERDLSHLGEILADRIQCEDQVIDALQDQRRKKS